MLFSLAQAKSTSFRPVIRSPNPRPFMIMYNTARFSELLSPCIVVCRSSIIIDHWSKTLSDAIFDYGKCSIDYRGKKVLLTNKNIKTCLLSF